MEMVLLIKLGNGLKLLVQVSEEVFHLTSSIKSASSWTAPAMICVHKLNLFLCIKQSYTGLVNQPDLLMAPSTYCF